MHKLNKLQNCRANAEGEVDVTTMESLGGQYEGVFPMGLIGNLLPAFNEFKYTRFFKRDVENPNLVSMIKVPLVVL